MGSVSATVLNEQFHQARLAHLNQIRRAQFVVRWGGHNPAKAPPCDNKGHTVLFFPIRRTTLGVETLF